MDAAEPAVVSGKDAGYGRDQGVCGSSFQNQGAGEGETEMVVVREGERARGLKSGMFGMKGVDVFWQARLVEAAD